MLPMAAFPLANVCVYIKFDQNYTPLKMEADNKNRPSIYA